VETGWNCNGGSTTTSDTWTDICADGVFRGSNPAKCDDGNLVDGDGCDSTWNIEIGWTWAVPVAQTASVCSSICGDGLRMLTEEWDDGNINDGDGWSQNWVVEIGYLWTGGSPTTPDTWDEICGDGLLISTNPADCDDNNTKNGDGWSSSWRVETGWECQIPVGSTISSCTTVCGDGLSIMSEEWDDGNTNSQDGCSLNCKIESGFIWTTNSSNTPNTEWVGICGDGLRVMSEQWDDGNTKNKDGCSDSWVPELGYVCSGGSLTSKDMCLLVWGDGLTNENPLICDDGNNVNGDGWSSECEIEDGYICNSSTLGASSVWTEICGDGRRSNAIPCDDGNTIDGDGCSSTCTIEAGYTCSGGTMKKKDTWKEIWGDGINIGASQWDDGNTANGDGCSSICEYEKWYTWLGGSPTTGDTCSLLHITPTFGPLQSDNSISLSFSHDMYSTNITLNDLSISIESDYLVSFVWVAKYINSTTMLINLNIGTALTGKEVLTIKFINYKTIRGVKGGWIQPEFYSTTLPSSLSSQADSASFVSTYMQYFVGIGVILVFGLLMWLGNSLEMIWSLINTLQFISYLPLMIPYYPDHVKIMFHILGFVNMDFQFMSDIFEGIVPIGGVTTPAYNSRFLDNGIDTPLFLNNWSSLLLSLMLSIASLILLVLFNFFLRCEKIKENIAILISSYFFWNFIRFFTEGYLEISFGALLNVASFDMRSTTEICSLAISLTTLIMWILFPFMSFAFLFDKREAIKAENITYLKRFGTIYKDFRTDKEWYKFQYYPIFLLRRLIFAIFLIVFLDYPELQWNSFILLSSIVSDVIWHLDVLFSNNIKTIQTRCNKLSVLSEWMNIVSHFFHSVDFHNRH
jgi:cysteine-rich repeat protein